MRIFIVKPTKKEIVGQRLKDARIKRHLTIQQVANATGISASAISCYENGKRYPTNVSLFRLSEYYVIPRKDIVGENA
ncbi:MAG: helix-turn-helix transcriptional regulator [Acutalibacteraceae bacterium]|nr:helix-turn-helix transcriptional regulator [Acutalibacteraceae bacterium]